MNRPANTARWQGTKPAEVPSDPFVGPRTPLFTDLGVLIQPRAEATVVALQVLKTEALDWLHQFVGGDVVPVHAVHAAATDAGLYWSIVRAVAAESVIDKTTILGHYWQFPKPSGWTSAPDR